MHAVKQEYTIAVGQEVGVDSTDARCNELE